MGGRAEGAFRVLLRLWAAGRGTHPEQQILILFAMSAKRMGHRFAGVDRAAAGITDRKGTAGATRKELPFFFSAESAGTQMGNRRGGQMSNSKTGGKIAPKEKNKCATPRRRGKRGEAKNTRAAGEPKNDESVPEMFPWILRTTRERGKSCATR